MNCEMTIEEAGVIAVGMSEHLDAKEQAFFVSGFQEAIKYLTAGVKPTVKELETENKAMLDVIEELQDFCIWLTGCGYDFCQHDYFIEQRDKLLKDTS